MTTAALDVSAEFEQAAEPPRRPWGLPAWLNPRAVALIVLGVGAFFYLGPSQVGPTLLKIVVAVAISVALFVGVNKLFDLTYDRWTQFTTIAAFVVGALAFVALDGNHLLRDVPPRPWAWTAIGGLAAGAALYVIGQSKEQAARLPIAGAGFAAVGVLLAVAVDDRWYPGLDWVKLLICTAVGAVLGAATRSLGKSASSERVQRAALVGAAVGWLIGAWGGATFASTSAETGELGGGGNILEALLATVVPLAAIGMRIGLATEPAATQRRTVEAKSRSWIFLAPALTFIAGGLLVPLVRTVVLSFKSRDSSEYVGVQNYREMFKGTGFTQPFFDVSDWRDLFGSRLFWFGIAVVAFGVAVGVGNGRRTRRAFEAAPSSTLPLLAGFFLAACAVLATLRGTFFNNIWWVLVVTTLATSLGLAVAVLADRAKGENVAKSLIFLPMAISFVGAGIIWQFMYQQRNVQDDQIGVLNALWVALGRLSDSWVRWPVALVAVALVAGLGWIAWNAVQTGYNTRAGWCIGLGLVLAWLLYRLLGPGLGGLPPGESSSVIDFIRESPYNNLWLMVILIWIQTGFAMVIFSSAIKGVPVELTEAARIDGATESQVFWRITLAQIMPTIGVVVTTLIVTVMKVFDIVKVTTNGNFDTQVVANQMFEAISTHLNTGLGAALATALFLAVLPVMVYNIRRMQKG